MMRTQPATIAFRGAVARAMAAAYDRRDPQQDVQGTMPCPHCRSTLQFTTLASGASRGQCTSAGCVRWAA